MMVRGLLDLLAQRADETVLPDGRASEGWRDQALCVSSRLDPDLWFPEKGRTEVARAAKRVCQHCPVLDECRTWALAHPQLAEHGVWGGLTPKERRAFDRERVA